MARYSTQQRRSILDVNFENDGVMNHQGDINEPIEAFRAVAQAVNEDSLKELIEKQPGIAVEWIKAAYSENLQIVKELNDMESKTFKEIRDLKKMIQDWNVHINNLTTDLANEWRWMQTSASVESDSSKNRSMKFPDPEKFENNEDGRFKQWLRAMRDKLRSNADHFLTENHKISYVYSWLRGEAFNILKPQMNEDSPEMFLTAEEVLKEVDEIYGDKDE